MTEALRTWLDVVRRQWWIVALTVAVAVGISYATSRAADEPEPVFEGRAQIAVEPKTLSKYYRLPSVDELLTDVESDAFLTRAAEGVEVDPERLQDGLRVFSLKSPQTVVIVAYRSSESSEALRIAEEMAKRVASRARTLGKEEVEQTAREIRITERAIGQIEALSLVSDPAARRSEREAAARDLWEMRLELESLKDGLNKIKTAYSFSEETSVRELPVIQRRASGVAGAVLAGLALGLALAAVREALQRRSSARSTRPPDAAA